MILAEARDRINEMILNAWQPRYALWDNVAGSPPVTDIPWIRASIRHASGRQGSLGNDVGNIIWERTGLVIIQLFVPTGAGLLEHDELAALLMAAFEKPNISAIWFRNTSIREIGIDGRWFNSNIQSNFSYEEVK